MIKHVAKWCKSVTSTTTNDTKEEKEQKPRILPHIQKVDNELFAMCWELKATFSKRVMKLSQTKHERIDLQQVFNYGARSQEEALKNYQLPATWAQIQEQKQQKLLEPFKGIEVSVTDEALAESKIMLQSHKTEFKSFSTDDWKIPSSPCLNLHPEPFTETELIDVDGEICPLCPLMEEDVVICPKCDHKFMIE